MDSVDSCGLPEVFGIPSLGCTSLVEGCLGPQLPLARFLVLLQVFRSIRVLQVVLLCLFANLQLKFLGEENFLQGSCKHETGITDEC